MHTPESAHTTSQEQLISIRKEIQTLTIQETDLRKKRNAAVLVAVSRQIPVAHLARDVGVSRELLHRILHSDHGPIPEPVPTAGEAHANVLAAQESLTTIADKRVSVQTQRAVAILRAAASHAVTRKEIALCAGVSSETVRKICLGN